MYSRLSNFPESDLALKSYMLHNLSGNLCTVSVNCGLALWYDTGIILGGVLSVRPLGSARSLVSLVSLGVIQVDHGIVWYPILTT